MSPGGFLTVVAMPVVGLVLWPRDGRPVGDHHRPARHDRRNYWMSQLNLEISPGQVVWPRWCWSWAFQYASPANVASFTFILHRCYAERLSAC